MYIEELFDHKVIRHGGGWVGFSTRYARFPELELSVVVFCNSDELDAYEYSDKLTEVAVKAFAATAELPYRAARRSQRPPRRPVRR
jgi:CubicO group peptidase (beta-lactamase class C family)